MKAVNDAMEESANVVSVMLKFAASLIAPEEDEGTVTLQVVGKLTLSCKKLSLLNRCDHSVYILVLTLQ